MDNVFTQSESKFDTSLFFKLMFENAKEATILILDREGIILDVNIGVHKVFGYSREELVGENFSILFTEEDKRRRKPEIELAAVMQKSSATDQAYILHKEGMYIWTKEESFFTKNKKGEIFIVKIIYDINEQNILEKFLVSSNEFLESIIETINHPLVVLDNEMRILKVNKCFSETLCKTDKLNLHKSIFKTCDGLWKSEDLRIRLEKILTENKPIKDFEVEFDCPPYGIKYFSLNAIPITGREKQHGILIAITDITLHTEAKKKLNEEKEDLNKIKKNLDTFVYSASHDLKAPINNIEGLANTLENSTDCTEDCKKLIFMLKESVIKFKHTLEDLSAIGKAQEESKKNITEVEFKEVLEEVKFDLHDMINASNAIITDDFSKALSINIAKINLRSVLYNLISNAIKYRHPDRKPDIYITTEKHNSKYILLKISDNGLGIKKEDIGKVFFMYKRLHNGGTEGTGVGMAIVARIIDNNGGKIEIESEVGKGTTFKIYFKI